MELHNRNQSEQLPYEKLALLGIDREKADNLPQEVKERLVSGEVTPLMQVSISARNGDVITLPLKLQMTADKDGNPALLAYPVGGTRNGTEQGTPTDTPGSRTAGQRRGTSKSRGGERRENTAVPTARPGNEIGHPPQGDGHRNGTETQRHGEGKRHRTGHAAEAAGTGRQARGAERGRREGLRGHRSQRATGVQAHQGRHEGMGKAAEAPLRRPAPRIPRPRDDRQEPLGVPAGGGRTIQGACPDAQTIA